MHGRGLVEVGAVVVVAEAERRVALQLARVVGAVAGIRRGTDARVRARLAAHVRDRRGDEDVLGRCLLDPQQDVPDRVRAGAVGVRRADRHVSSTPARRAAGWVCERRAVRPVRRRAGSCTRARTRPGRESRPAAARASRPPAAVRARGPRATKARPTDSTALNLVAVIRPPAQVDWGIHRTPRVEHFQSASAPGRVRTDDSRIKSPELCH